MKNHRFVFLVILAASMVSASVLFTNERVFAQTNPANETIAITTNIDPITILTNELIPLFDSSAIGNLTAVSVTANLPCDGSNVPKLKIIAGVLGNTTTVIDSSSDYTNNKGPRDTCVFTDSITNITEAGVPAINRIFVKNTGSTPVHIPEGVIVTLSGIFGLPPVVIPPNPCGTAVFCDDYSSSADWTILGTNWDIDSTVAGKIHSGEATSTDRAHKSIGTTLSNTAWVVEFDIVRHSTEGHNSRPFVLTAGTGHPESATQDAIGVYINTNLQTFYKDGSSAIVVDTDVIGMTKDTTYYARITRDSATQITLSLFTDSARTTHASGSPVTQTIPATVVGLTYLQHSGNDNVSIAQNLEIDNTIVWDGVTSPP